MFFMLIKMSKQDACAASNTSGGTSVCSYRRGVAPRHVVGSALRIKSDPLSRLWESNPGPDDRILGPDDSAKFISEFCSEHPDDTNVLWVYI